MSRFEALKGDGAPPGDRFQAFGGGDRREGSGSGSPFGAKREGAAPFARRGEGDERRAGEGSGAPPREGGGSGSGAFGERRPFAARRDGEARPERDSNPAFSSSRGGEGGQRAPREERQGNFAAFGGDRQREGGGREGGFASRGGERAGERGGERGGEREQQGERRTFPAFAGRAAEQTDGAGAAPADPNNRFAKFVAEAKTAAPAAEAAPAPVNSRFAALREDSGAGSSAGASGSGAAGAEGASASAGPSFAAAAAAGAAFTPRPFAVRKDAAGSALPEAPTAFSGMRDRDGMGGGRGGGMGGGGRGERETPAAFANMRRAGEAGPTREFAGGGERGGSGGTGFGGREFPAFAQSRPMPAAFMSDRRPGDPGARASARMDSVGMPDNQTVQNRYKVNLLTLASKEDGGLGKGNDAKAAAIQAQPGAAAPSPSGAAAPATVNALAKASAMGDDVVRATFARAARARLEDFLADLSKDAAKKAAADLAKLAAVNKAVLAPYSANMVAQKGLATEAASERRSLGGLLNALRSGNKKEPALCSDEEVAAAVEGVVAAVPAGEEGLPSRILLFTVVESMTGAKGGIPAAALGPATQALLEEKPAVVRALSAEEEESLAASLAAASVEGGGSVSWGDATAAGAPASAAKPAQTAVDTQADADAAAEALIATGKLGADLLAAATEEFVGFHKAEAAAALMSACLKAGHAKGWVNSKCTWLSKANFRPLLAAFCHGKTKASVSALFRLQSFFAGIDFPLGDKNVPVILRAFEAMYNDDVVEEEPMQEWRNDMRNTTAGHDKALMQLEDFFEWLDNAEEEDEEEDEEEEMEGIVKPNNRGMLR